MTRPTNLKPQKGNPHRLSIKQHIFPVKSILRFSKSDGRVWVFDGLCNRKRRAKPSDKIFCTHWAWDERTETVFMKEIEDEFQALALHIIEGKIIELVERENAIVNRFYGLWYTRSRQRHLPSQEIQAHGVTGNKVTDDQAETLDKNGVLFIRENGKLPTRHINGIQIRIKASRYALETLADTKWGIVETQRGEFIVPDVPYHTIIPIDPRHCLVSHAPAPIGIIVEQNVAEINNAIRSACHRYFFARDFKFCPF